MGTVGFHLEMVLKWILTGALKTNPTTHTVQHPLNPSHSVGCFPAMEALSQDNRLKILTRFVLHLQRQPGEEVVLAGKMPNNLQIKRFHPMLCLVRPQAAL